jgi:hypothetical protein
MWTPGACRGVPRWRRRLRSLPGHPTRGTYRCRDADAGPRHLLVQEPRDAGQAHELTGVGHGHPELPRGHGLGAGSARAGTRLDRSSVHRLRPTRCLHNMTAMKLVVSSASWSRSLADTHSRRYVLAVLDQYVSFPGTPCRASRQDRRLARDLYEQACGQLRSRPWCASTRLRGHSPRHPSIRSRACTWIPPQSRREARTYARRGGAAVCGPPRRARLPLGGPAHLHGPGCPA